MKFLVIGEGVDFTVLPNPKDFVAFIENGVVPSFEILDKWTREGKIVGGNFVARRKGAFIMDAASAEEVSDLLTSLPLWGQIRFEVHPLESAQAVLERTKKQLQQLKAGAVPHP